MLANQLPDRKMPSVAEIAEHWALRCLICDCSYEDCLYRITGPHPDPMHERMSMFNDPGEPECARCEAFLGYVGKKVRADRAHIISRWQLAYGSVDDNINVSNIDRVENIILLCHECHREDPEPPTRREYLNWLILYRTNRWNAFDAVCESLKNGADVTSPLILAGIRSALPNWSEKYKNEVISKIINDTPSD